MDSTSIIRLHIYAPTNLAVRVEDADLFFPALLYDSYSKRQAGFLITKMYQLVFYQMEQK